MAIVTTLVNLNPFRLLISFFALAFVASKVANARPCVTFDSNFNLYAFGFGGKDFNLGSQSGWGSTVTPTDITSPGRPSFDGQQTTCYLAQFFNAIYVLDGDTSNPSAVYIFNPQNKTWSTQAVGSGGPDPTSLVAILDHDTNVFYALDGNSMFSLDLGTQTQATSSTLQWTLVGNPPFSTTNYTPTLGLAQNHVYFFGVPNTPAGSAEIYVIHFSFFQPTAQNYPVSNGGSSFPSTHGSATSFFQNTGVQQEIAFIPDGGSMTYVVNVESNTTVALAGPSDKTSSTFVASVDALVQLTSKGSLAFLPYTQGNSTANMLAAWSTINVQGLPAVSSGNSSTNSTASSTSGSGTVTASGAGSTGTTSNKNEGSSLLVRYWVTTLAGVAVTVMVLL